MERIAFISDVHACREALIAVLDEISQFGIRQVACLGDVVGYGSDPLACVELVRQVAETCILGNHEAMMVAQGFDLIGLGTQVAQPLLLAQNQLSDELLNWIKKLPLTWHGDGIEACHSSLSDPAFFTHMAKGPEVARHFSRQSAPIAFFGHTHVPSVYHLDPKGKIRFARGKGQINLRLPGKYAVGVGSVGFSRDGDPRACWTEFDPATRTVIFRRVPYDYEAFERKMKRTFGGIASRSEGANDFNHRE